MITLGLSSKKLSLAICSLVLLLVIYYNFFFSGKFSQIQVLQRVLPRKQQKLVEMQEMQQKYLEAKKEDSEAEGLIVVLEQTALELNLRENISQLDPLGLFMNNNIEELKVQLQFKYISFNDLLLFLEKVEKRVEGLKIDNLTINSDDNNSLLVAINFSEQRIGR